MSVSLLSIVGFTFIFMNTVQSTFEVNVSNVYADVGVGNSWYKKNVFLVVQVSPHNNVKYDVSSSRKFRHVGRGGKLISTVWVISKTSIYIHNVSCSVF